MSPFHTRTARPISTKFCTDLSTNSGKVLNTSMTPPTQPLNPRVPKTLKPKRVTGEKTLCNITCPDGWRKLIKFFLGPGWLVYNIFPVILRFQYSHFLADYRDSSWVNKFLFDFPWSIQTKTHPPLDYYIISQANFNGQVYFYTF